MSWWKPEAVKIDLSKYGTPAFNKSWDEIKKRRSPYYTYEEHIQEISAKIKAEVEHNIRPVQLMLSEGNYSGYAQAMTELGYLTPEDIVNSVALYRIKRGDYDESNRGG